MHSTYVRRRFVIFRNKDKEACSDKTSKVSKEDHKEKKWLDQQSSVGMLHSLFKLSLFAAPLSSIAVKPNDFGLLEWIHNSDGGFVNPKQVFRYENPDDPTSLAGVFATERIEANETLLKVPWDLIISSTEFKKHKLPCGLVNTIAQEMALAADPYARYLNALPDSQMPSAWSRAGKELLQTLLGGTEEDPMIFPNVTSNWLDFEWYSGCLKGKPSTSLHDKAVLLIVSRSDDTEMIPGYDM